MRRKAFQIGVVVFLVGAMLFLALINKAITLDEPISPTTV